MSVLAILAMQLLSTSHVDDSKFSDLQEVEIMDADSDSEVDVQSSGHRRRHRRAHLRRTGRTRGQRDRTAWGSYMEHAPPVLPAGAWVPGFENEVLALGRRVGQLQGADDADGERDDDSGDEEEAVDSEERAERGLRQRRPAGGSTLPALPSLAGWLREFPASLLSYHSASSSLFGSTTRPAANRLLPEPAKVEQDALDVSRRVSTPSSSTSGRARTTRSAMGAKTHLWVTLWFLLSAPVIFWDASYLFMRPRSFAGGDLHWIWEPYSIYQEVDYVYGTEAYARQDGFPNAQSLMNIIETLINLYYVYAQHVLGSPSAPLVGIAAVSMTLSKTVLYWAQEYYCGGCTTGHNNMVDWLTFWVLPNGIWLLVPSLILYRLWSDASTTLRFADKLASGKKK